MENERKNDVKLKGEEPKRHENIVAGRTAYKFILVHKHNSDFWLRGS